MIDTDRLDELVRRLQADIDAEAAGRVLHAHVLAALSDAGVTGFREVTAEQAGGVAGRPALLVNLSLDRRAGKPAVIPVTPVTLTVSDRGAHVAVGGVSDQQDRLEAAAWDLHARLPSGPLHDAVADLHALVCADKLAPAVDRLRETLQEVTGHYAQVQSGVLRHSGDPDRAATLLGLAVDWTGTPEQLDQAVDALTDRPSQ